MIGYVTLGTNNLDRAAGFTMPAGRTRGDAIYGNEGFHRMGC